MVASSSSEPPDPARDRGSLSVLKQWGKRAAPWALLALALWLIIQDVQRRATMPQGSEAPELVLGLSDGSQFTLTDREEVVVLNFWATWCPPCRAEAPELSRAHRELERRGLGRVVGLSTDTMELPTIVEKARSLGMMYPIGQAGPEVLSRYRVTTLPTTYVITSTGKIARSFVGGVTEEQVVEAVMAASDNAK
jgi:thiol-disulfide isomerase/thioredoxin